MPGVSLTKAARFPRILRLFGRVCAQAGKFEKRGQQTTRILHQHAARNLKATVLVRVISVPRESEQDSSRFERGAVRRSKIITLPLSRA